MPHSLESDAGKKSLRVAPMLMQDSGQIAREWLKANAPAISQAVQARLKEAGFPELPR